MIDADDAAVAFATGAGAHRIVEAEQVGAGLVEADTIGLEAVAIASLLLVRPQQDQLTLTLEEGALRTVGHPALHLGIARRGHYTVHHQEPGALQRGLPCQQVLDAVYRPAVVYPRKALLVQDIEVLAKATARRQVQGGQEQHRCARPVAVHPGHHIIHRMAANLVPGHW